MSCRRSRRIALGKLAPEGQQPPPPDLEAAAAFVDMLGMLEAKTTGNRNAHEDQIIKSSLDQLHIIFVEVARKAGAEVPPSATEAAQPAAAAPPPPAAPAPTPGAEKPATPPAPAGPPAEEKVKYRKSYG